jgi:hypothetical protein
MNLREKIRQFVTTEVKEGKKEKKLSISALRPLSVSPFGKLEGLDKDAAIKLFKDKKKKMERLDKLLQLRTITSDDEGADIHKLPKKEKEEAKLLKIKTDKAHQESLDKAKTGDDIKKLNSKKALADDKRPAYDEEYFIRRLGKQTIERLFNEKNPFCPSEKNIELLKGVIGEGLFSEFDEEVEARIKKSICSSKTCEVMDCLGPASTIYLSQYRHKSLGPFRTEPDTRHEAKIDLCESCFKQNKDLVLKKDYATLFKQALKQYGINWLSQYMEIDESKFSRIKNYSDEFKVIDKTTSIKIHRLLVGASEEAMLLHIRNVFNDSQKDPSCIKRLAEKVFPMPEHPEPDFDREFEWPIINAPEGEDIEVRFGKGYPDKDDDDYDHYSWLHPFVEENLAPKPLSTETVENTLLENYQLEAYIFPDLEFEYAFERINKEGEGSISVAVNILAMFAIHPGDFAGGYEDSDFNIYDLFEYDTVRCVLERTIDFKNPKELKLRVLNKITS